MLRINGGHLRPTPLSCLYFLMGLCSTPQTGELLTNSSAQPVPTPCMGTLGAADLPMEEEGKAAWGRAAAAHVGCFVFLCFVFLSRAAFFCYQRYLICKKLITDQPK